MLNDNLIKGINFAFRVVSSLGLLLMLSGCMGSLTYWAPVTQGGRLHYSDNCSTAPSNSVEFTLNDVRIDLTGHGNGIGMYIQYTKGQSVSFVSDTALFYLPELAKVSFVVEAPSYNSKDQEWIKFNPTSTLTSSYNFTKLHFGEQNKEKYRIKMPAIKINEQVYEIPEIEFTQKQGFAVFCIF